MHQHHSAAPVACLFVPSLALAVELAERPALAHEPVALADDAGQLVADLTQEAERRGVRVGQTLSEAEAYCPRLHVLEPHHARLARAQDALLEALERVSPLVEDAARLPAGDPVEWGLAFADLRGLEQLFTPHEFVRTVFEALPRPLRARARLGIAPRRFTAYVAARLAEPDTDGYAVRRVAAGEDETLLAGQPAAWLPLPPRAVADLRLYGIDSIGAFAALPQHAVQAQFGPAGARAWLAARGEDPTRVRARPPASERVVERSHAEPPLVSRESVERSVEQLLGRALRQRRAQGRFVRSVRLRATTEDDRLWERTHTMKEPTGDRRRLWTALRPILDRADYPGPLAELELELGGLTEESGRQSGLFVDRHQARRREQLDEMVRHLKLRYGRSPLARVVAVEPWHRLPERRHALLDYEP